ncbi:MAG: FHIPEP family type III secretion protein [Parafilimonas sp.]
MLPVTININPRIKLANSKALEQRLKETLQHVMQRYGIQYATEVKVIQQEPADYVVSVHINGEELVSSYFLANFIWCYTKDMHIENNNSEKILLNEISEYNDEKIVEPFLHDYVIEIVKENMEALVTDELVEKILDEQGLPFRNAFYFAGKILIKKLLAHHISIDRFRSRFNEIADKNAEDLGEEIIAESRNKMVTIVCSENYFLDIISGFNNSDKNIFKTIDEGMFYELGIDFPDVEFKMNDDVPYGLFRICVNDFETMLIKGLNATEAIILQTDLIVAENFSSSHLQTIIHPANNRLCNIINDTDEAPPDVQIWPPFAFMALYLVNLYQRKANLFFDLNTAKNIISELNITHPQLMECVRKKANEYFICRILRSLLEEKISLRNMESIFQSIVDFDYIVADGMNNIVFDSRLTTLTEPDEEWLKNPDNIADFARINLKHYISSAATNSSYSLSVYLLDPEIEKLIINTAGKASVDILSAEIIRCAEKEIANNSNSFYPVLTTVEVRKKCKRIIEKRFPDLSVLCYQELAPQTNITAVSRITLTTANYTKA